MWLVSSRLGLGNIVAHKLPQHLCSRLVRAAARFSKFVPQLALHSYAEPDVFHDNSVTNGYTFQQRRMGDSHSSRTWRRPKSTLRKLWLTRPNKRRISCAIHVPW